MIFLADTVYVFLLQLSVKHSVYEKLNGDFYKNTHHPVGIACKLSLSITVLKEKDPPSSGRS